MLVSFLRNINTVAKRESSSIFSINVYYYFALIDNLQYRKIERYFYLNFTALLHHTRWNRRAHGTRSFFIRDYSIWTRLHYTVDLSNLADIAGTQSFNSISIECKGQSLLKCLYPDAINRSSPVERLWLTLRISRALW